MSVWGVSLIRDVCLGWGTYHVVLDAIDLGVSLIGAADLVEVVLNPVDAQHANLLERPAGHALGELAVERLDGLGGAGLLHLGVEPLVGEDLGRADQCEARRRARLERRDERELLAGRERVVDRLGLGAGVVAVGGRGGAEQRRQELAGAEGGAYAVGEGNDLVSGGAGAEDVLDARAVAAGGREEEHVVLVGGAGRVVVEVVDDEAGALSGELDVELGEEGDEGGRGRGVGAQGDEDVAVGVEELEEQLAGQLGAQACDGRLAWRWGIWELESRFCSPFSLDGKRMTWSYARSPRWNSDSDSLFGVSNDSLNPLPAARHWLARLSPWTPKKGKTHSSDPQETWNTQLARRRRPEQQAACRRWC